jgi:hypothetical protein
MPLDVFMNRDPRFALSQELEAKQTLLDQLRALAADDPDFFTDLLEGETNLLELIAALDASIADDTAAWAGEHAKVRSTIHRIGQALEDSFRLPRSPRKGSHRLQERRDLAPICSVRA